jgi:hypothetical protein
MKADIRSAHLCLEDCYLVRFHGRILLVTRNGRIASPTRMNSSRPRNNGPGSPLYEEVGARRGINCGSESLPSGAFFDRTRTCCFRYSLYSAQGALRDDASDTITTRAKQIWLPYKGVLPTKNPGKSKQAYMGSSLLSNRRRTRLFPRNPLHHRPSPVTGG